MVSRLLRLEGDARRRAEERAQRQQEARGLALLRAQPAFELLPLSGLEQAALELTLGVLGPLAADQLRAAAASGGKAGDLSAAQELGRAKEAVAAAEEAGQGGGRVLAAEAATAGAVAAEGQGIGGAITSSRGPRHFNDQ